MISQLPIVTAPSARFRQLGYVELAGERCRGLVGAGLPRRWLKHLYHQVLMLQSGGRGLQSQLPGGEVVRLLPRHRQLSWNPAEYAAFRAAVQPGMLAFDIGANVGAYSLLLAEWVGRRGAVYAFEPEPSLYEGLRAHVSLNRLESVVTPVAAAISDHEGTGAFLVAETTGEGRLAMPAEEAGRAQQVFLLTIDSFCARAGVTPDFIKIDVEGWELAALRGARETIRRAGANLWLFVELHPSRWPALNITRQDVLEELDRLGLEIVPLTPGCDPWTVEGVSVRLRLK